MRAAILIAALALAACQTPCPAVDRGPVSATFTCEDGSELAITFLGTPDEARIVQEGYAPLQLPARTTGSGFRYSDNGAELRGRGLETRWTRPGAVETLCRRAH